MRFRRTVALAMLTITLVVPLVTSSTPVHAAAIVCIDPGHGGSETGSSGGGILEKDLNLNVARKLGDVLVSRDYAVEFTRTDDSNPSRTARAQFCNSKQATVLISVHHNGSSDPAVDYTTALYQKRIDKALAAAVSQAVARDATGLMSRTGQFASAVLLKSDMPATISEGYFLTSTAEQAKLTDFDLLTGSCSYCQTEAEAIANGVKAYLGL